MRRRFVLGFSLSFRSFATVSYETMATEGLAKIMGPIGCERDVFYNPTMKSNRDLTVSMIHTFYNALPHLHRNNNRVKRSYEQIEENGLSILDGFSASGVRTVRFIKELPKEAIRAIHANDIDEKVAAIMNENFKSNFNGTIPSLITSHCSNINTLMNERSNYFDIIDIDPYGSPVEHINPAIRSLTHGGMLCVTATDMMVLCGSFPANCYRKYGAVSFGGSNCHEMALRILLGFIATRASHEGKTIVPLLSFSSDHYIRVFVQVFQSGEEANRLPSKLGYVHRCIDCMKIETAQILELKKTDNIQAHFHHRVAKSNICSHCGAPVKMYGPAWLDHIHDDEITHNLSVFMEKEQEAFGFSKKLVGQTKVISSELHHPFAVTLSHFSSQLKMNHPSLKIFSSALIRSGFMISRTHTHKNLLKTNATHSKILELLKTWNHSPHLELFSPFDRHDERLVGVYANSGFGSNGGGPGKKHKNK